MFPVAISPPEMTFTYCVMWGCWMGAQDMDTQQTELPELSAQGNTAIYLILEGVWVGQLSALPCCHTVDQGHPVRSETCCCVSPC